MDTVLYHKFTQHKDLKRELLATGDAELIEVGDLRPIQGYPTLTDETPRTRIKIRSGGVGQMERVRMNSGKHLDDCVNIYANSKGGKIAEAPPYFLRV